MSQKLIQIRLALAEDLSVLVAILHSAFAEYEGQLDPPSGALHESENTLLEKLKEGGAFLAFAGGKAVGCVFFEVHEDYVYLGRLSVLPEHRKQGVARALINQVEQQARDLGKSRVQLGTRLALPQLLAYYARLGYQPISYVAHPGYTQPTYAIMEKVLPDPQPF